MIAEYPTISDDPAVQEFYEDCRRRGESHNLAEMFATRRGPNLNTDTTFMAGLGTLRDDFTNENELNRVVKAAKKNGYTPKASDHYDPFLANKCGDPLAFIPSANPKGHVRKVCEKRDQTCHGAVEVKRKAK